ncbi:MAG: bifunctional adenosylcobinamide kinase/adenosylcobinamide-phosphate guanylyltransferase [Treponemataceae bacterium]|nr:bifunctional adenosylcobinamide kinase/adenosylcobinamide-phosphate guanylyltransferase [Treponemataceae bacterium]
MIIFVYGGSGSGKSSFAEKCLSSFEGSRLYYIATMKVFDDEGRAKIQRHRKLREGKGFITIEQPTDMALVAEKLMGQLDKSLERASRTGKCSVLLECVTNLVANEMFTEKGPQEEACVVSKIEKGLEKLFSIADNVVVVSGNVSADGAEYSETTLSYMRALGKVNSFIASECDEAYELVAGIPLPLFGQVK